MEPDLTVLRRFLEPTAGRIVLITDDAWTHVREHLETAPFLDAVVETITHPDHWELDERPGRERYSKQGVGPSRFLTAVVEFADNEGELVTAFGHRNEDRQ